MNLNEVLLAAFSIISSLIIVFFVVILGWYLVWKLFLSRFRLVRELLGQMNGDPTNNGRGDRPVRARRVRRD